MSTITPADVERFTHLVDLAETGELQDAVKRVGFTDVNPYYYEDPKLVNVVGFFMNVVAPLAQDSYENGSSIQIRHAMETPLAAGIDYLEVRRTFELANRAHYLVEDAEVGVVGSVYRPTHDGMQVGRADVFRTRFDHPNSRGCITSVASLGVGAATLWVAGVDVMTAEAIVPAVGLGSGLAYASAQLGLHYGKIRAGREAYRYYHQ